VDGTCATYGTVGNGTRALGVTETTGGVEGGAALRLRHDLRQPLATVNLLVEAITSSCGLPADVVARLRQIQNQTAWMGRLLCSDQDSGDPVAVVDLADTVAGPCSTTPPGAPYVVRFDKFDVARVLVDPVGLERTARNLMDNATRAVSGGGKVEVQVWAENRRGVLEVADNGPGFGHLPPQHGHGLVGVRRFAERFGGALECGTSSLGGALVTLHLPLAVGW